MTEMNEFQPGMFCWVDLLTTSAGGAKQFYTELFGWTAADAPVSEEGGIYTIYSKNGKQACAQCEMFGEMLERGLPPHWQSYVSVTNADEIADKAGSLGGTVLQPAFDVMDVGRMAVLQDPAGAAFALWQSKAHKGAELVNVPGTLCWNELFTKDTEVAESFYTNLFGWSTEGMPSPTGAPYTVFKIDDRPAGGMLEVQEDMGNIHPHWAVYFAVEGCDSTLEQAQALGAQVSFPPMDIPDVGRIAGLRDPQGANFSIIELFVAPD